MKVLVNSYLLQFPEPISQGVLKADQAPLARVSKRTMHLWPGSNSEPHSVMGQTWWLTPVIAAIRTPRQEESWGKLGWCPSWAVWDAWETHCDPWCGLPSSLLDMKEFIVSSWELQLHITLKGVWDFFFFQTDPFDLAKRWTQDIFLWMTKKSKSFFLWCMNWRSQHDNINTSSLELARPRFKWHFQKLNL